jgi:hypothetical protein
MQARKPKDKKDPTPTRNPRSEALTMTDWRSGMKTNTRADLSSLRYDAQTK